MIEVVSAVIVQHGRILLQQRPPSKDYAFRWETPGGKVEGNESHHDAIRRELREELGLKIGAICETSIWSGRVQRNGREPVFMAFYFIGEWEGAPTPNESQGLGWFTASEIERMLFTLTPGTFHASRLLIDFLDRLERSGSKP